MTGLFKYVTLLPIVITIIYYTTSQTFLNRKIYHVFERILFCSASLRLFDPKYSKSSNIVQFSLFKITAFYLNIFSNVIYSCDQS